MAGRAAADARAAAAAVLASGDARGALSALAAADDAPGVLAVLTAVRGPPRILAEYASFALGRSVFFLAENVFRAIAGGPLARAAAPAAGQAVALLLGVFSDPRTVAASMSGLAETARTGDFFRRAFALLRAAIDCGLVSVPLDLKAISRVTDPLASAAVCGPGGYSAAEIEDALAQKYITPAVLAAIVAADRERLAPEAPRLVAAALRAGSRDCAATLRRAFPDAAVPVAEYRALFRRQRSLSDAGERPLDAGERPLDAGERPLDAGERPLDDIGISHAR